MHLNGYDQDTDTLIIRSETDVQLQTQITPPEPRKTLGSSLSQPVTNYATGYSSAKYSDAYETDSDGVRYKVYDNYDYTKTKEENKAIHKQNSINEAGVLITVIFLICLIGILIFFVYRIFFSTKQKFKELKKNKHQSTFNTQNNIVPQDNSVQIDIPKYYYNDETLIEHIVESITFKFDEILKRHSDNLIIQKTILKLQHDKNYNNIINEISKMSILSGFDTNHIEAIIEKVNIDIKERYLKS